MRFTRSFEWKYVFFVNTIKRINGGEQFARTLNEIARAYADDRASYHLYDWQIKKVHFDIKLWRRIDFLEETHLYGVLEDERSIEHLIEQLQEWFDYEAEFYGINGTIGFTTDNATIIVHEEQECGYSFIEIPIK